MLWQWIWHENKMWKKKNWKTQNYLITDDYCPLIKHFLGEIMTAAILQFKTVNKALQLDDNGKCQGSTRNRSPSKTTNSLIQISVQTPNWDERFNKRGVRTQPANSTATYVRIWWFNNANTPSGNFFEGINARNSPSSNCICTSLLKLGSFKHKLAVSTIPCFMGNTWNTDTFCNRNNDEYLNCCYTE